MEADFAEVGPLSVDRTVMTRLFFRAIENAGPFWFLPKSVNLGPAAFSTRTANRFVFT